MSITFINPAEAIQGHGLKMLVYGGAGTGKTVLCATANEPTLIISAEAGLLSIRNAPKNVTIVEVNDRQETEDVLRYLQTESTPAWVCIDSITEIADRVLDVEKQRHKNSWQSYGETKDIMSAMIRGFLDLPETNVLMTGTVKKEKDDADGKFHYECMMPGGSLRAAMPHFFDLVGAMRVFKDKDTGAVDHYIQTHRDDQWDAKDRSGLLDNYEAPSLASLKEKIRQPSSHKEAA